MLRLQRTAGNSAVAASVTQRQDRGAHDSQAPRVVAGPRIQAGNGTTSELEAERERLILERRWLHVSTIEPESEIRYNEFTASIRRLDLLLAERKDSALSDAGVALVFDGRALTASSGRSWPAVSGRPSGGGFDYTPARQRLEGVGPIPAGVYWLDPTQLVDLSDRWFYSWRYEEAWGTHRVTLHPFGTTHTFGRGGFFVHGGEQGGSAGCIDLTTGVGSFAKFLGVVPPGTRLKLTVSYPVDR